MKLIDNVPLRRCVGCLKMRPKSDLIRVVRTPSAQKIAIDMSGKKDGRGTYVCKDEECIRRAKKFRGLERSFKCKVNDDLYEELSLYE